MQFVKKPQPLLGKQGAQILIVDHGFEGHSQDSSDNTANTTTLVAASPGLVITKGELA